MPTSTRSFDRDNEVIRLGDLELLPSRVLFHSDREAYKAALNEYIAERDSGRQWRLTASEPDDASQEDAE